MYVCLCKGVTDKQIKAAVNEGARRMRCLREQTGLGSQCGKCCCEAKTILDQYVDSSRFELAIPA